MTFQFNFRNPHGEIWKNKKLIVESYGSQEEGVLVFCPQLIDLRPRWLLSVQKPNAGWSIFMYRIGPVVRLNSKVLPLQHDQISRILDLF